MVYRIKLEKADTNEGNDIMPNLQACVYGYSGRENGGGGNHVAEGNGQGLVVDAAPFGSAETKERKNLENGLTEFE